jgi:hypothetical protein
VSRRRLERGYWKGRQALLTDKEHGRVFVLRKRGGGSMGWYYRFGVLIHMDWPWPCTFELDRRRLPRKTLKALWKDLNGRPQLGEYLTRPMPMTALAPIHNGRKPLRKGNKG